MNLWEKAVVLAAGNFIKEGDTVLDIGSNIGGVAVNFSELVGETGKVLCFEANSELYDSWLIETSKSIYSNLELVNRAIWNRSGEALKLALDDSFYKSASSFVNNSVGVRNVLVESLAIDDLNLKEVAFIKLDIEGAEYQALIGAKELIATSRPYIILECVLPPNSEGINPLDILSLWSYEFFQVNNYNKISAKYQDEPGQFNILCIPKEKEIFPKSKRVFKWSTVFYRKSLRLKPGKYWIKVKLKGELSCQNGIGIYNKLKMEYMIYYMANIKSLQHSTNSSLPIFLEEITEIEIRMTNPCPHNHIASYEIYRLEGLR